MVPEGRGTGNGSGGRIVLITGAARGLGLATARAFLALGAGVAVNDRDPGPAESAVAGLKSEGRVAAAPADVATVTGCRQAVAQTIRAFGRLDILVNNAAINIEKPIADWDEDLWDRHLDVVLKGAFFATQAALPYLRANRGAVVNVASELGLRGVRDNVGYCAAKGGIVNLTRALALELAPDVRVNSVCPGPIDTPLMRECAIASGDPDAYYRQYAAYNVLGRVADPSEIAKAILFLASPRAAMITGVAFAIDGGSTAGQETGVGGGSR
ncbi:MAG: SDR family oxidoreductase [Alphaproteobacteria bacterium]|nr:SDR family oxidoreductase [Alphaproteobacteria bacterium]